MSSKGWKKWSDSDLKILLNKDLENQEAASRLGRSLSAIVSARHRLKIKYEPDTDTTQILDEIVALSDYLKTYNGLMAESAKHYLDILCSVV